MYEVRRTLKKYAQDGKNFANAESENGVMIQTKGNSIDDTHSDNGEEKWQQKRQKKIKAQRKREWNAECEIHTERKQAKSE